jgi:hypothetical protein
MIQRKPVEGDFTLSGRLFTDELSAWDWFATEFRCDPDMCADKMVVEEGAVAREVADEFTLSVLMRLTGWRENIREVLPPVQGEEGTPRVLYVALVREDARRRMLVMESQLHAPRLP